MTAHTPNDLGTSEAPPDPGGRSKYLVRGLAIAILLCVVVAAVLLFFLHRQTPPPTPNQRPQDSSSLVLPHTYA